MGRIGRARRPVDVAAVLVAAFGHADFQASQSFVPSPVPRRLVRSPCRSAARSGEPGRYAAPPSSSRGGDRSEVIAAAIACLSCSLSTSRTQGRPRASIDATTCAGEPDAQHGQRVPHERSHVLCAPVGAHERAHVCRAHRPPHGLVVEAVATSVVRPHHTSHPRSLSQRGRPAPGSPFGDAGPAVPVPSGTGVRLGLQAGSSTNCPGGMGDPAHDRADRRPGGQSDGNPPDTRPTRQGICRADRGLGRGRP